MQIHRRKTIFTHTLGLSKTDDVWTEQGDYKLVKDIKNTMMQHISTDFNEGSSQ